MVIECMVMILKYGTLFVDILSSHIFVWSCFFLRRDAVTLDEFFSLRGFESTTVDCDCVCLVKLYVKCNDYLLSSFPSFVTVVTCKSFL